MKSSRYPSADSFTVILYGSLAHMGKGHGTDEVLRKTFTKPVKVIFDTESPVPHPNTIDIYAYESDNKAGFWRVFSIGGGTIADGAALSIINRSGYGTYSSTDCSVTSVSISGGTFISASGFEAIQYYTYVGDNNVSALSDDQTIVSITGGEFSSSLTGDYSEYCIAGGYSVSDEVNSNGYYEVTKDEAAE